jgi:Rap1a immunity proteins
MGAVQDFSGAVDYETGKRLLGSCPGPKTNLTQLIRVFTNYARTHPQELHEKASLLVYRAMLEAFQPFLVLDPLVLDDPSEVYAHTRLTPLPRCFGCKRSPRRKLGLVAWVLLGRRLRWLPLRVIDLADGPKRPLASTNKSLA